MGGRFSRLSYFWLLGAACISGVALIWHRETRLGVNPVRAENAAGTPATLKLVALGVVTRTGNFPFGVAAQKDAPLLPVKADNPDKKTVDAELDGIRKRYDASKLAGANVYDAWHVDSPAAKVVFPGYRVYGIGWDGYEKEPTHPAVGL